jgi:4-hydroxybenzoate polyprenyltransferase
MRDRQRQRMADHPLENGRVQVVEVLLYAGVMLAALLAYLM